jgi:hypothetical protein
MQRAGLIERRRQAGHPRADRRRHRAGHLQPGGGTGWHVHPGPALVTVKIGQRTLHRAKGCRARAFAAGQTFLEFGPGDVNLTRNETAAVTETVVTFLPPVGAPITVDAPAPRCQL